MSYLSYNESGRIDEFHNIGMKPHLRNNHPVGQRPSAHKVITRYGCECRDCVASGNSIYKDDGRLVPGKYCSRDEYYEHRQRGIVDQRIPASSSARPSSDGAVPASSARTNPTARTMKGNQGQRKIRSVQSLTSIYQLEDIKSEYEENHKRLRSIVLADLVFQFSPTAYPSSESIPALQNGDINSGPFALEFNRAANKEILLYELWILQACTKIDAVPANGSSEVRSLKKDLIKKLDRDAERISEMKAREWRRRNELVKKGLRFVTGKEIIVNTGEHTYHLVYEKLTPPFAYFNSPISHHAYRCRERRPLHYVHHHCHHAPPMQHVTRELRAVSRRL